MYYLCEYHWLIILVRICVRGVRWSEIPFVWVCQCGPTKPTWVDIKGYCPLVDIPHTAYSFTRSQGGNLTQIISSSRWEGSGSVEACFCYLFTATSQFWPACHHHDPARILPGENPTRQRFSSLLLRILNRHGLMKLACLLHVLACRSQAECRMAYVLPILPCPRPGKICADAPWHLDWV